MKYILLFLFLTFLFSFVSSETTFFDTQDDLFIMSNSVTIDTLFTEITIGEWTCQYEWNCTHWSICSPFAQQIRNCSNTGTCSHLYNPPEIKQNCTYSAPEVKKED